MTINLSEYADLSQLSATGPLKSMCRWKFARMTLVSHGLPEIWSRLSRPKSLEVLPLRLSQGTKADTIGTVLVPSAGRFK